MRVCGVRNDVTQTPNLIMFTFKGGDIVSAKDKILEIMENYIHNVIMNQVDFLGGLSNISATIPPTPPLSINYLKSLIYINEVKDVFSDTILKLKEIELKLKGE